MAPSRYAVTQLSSLCTLVLFFYISQSLRYDSLAEYPQLSALLVLLVAGTLCFAASFLTQWLPAVPESSHRRTVSSHHHHQPGTGLLDVSHPPPPSGAALGFLLGGAQTNKPSRPRRFFVHAAVVCIVVRLELWRLVLAHEQCAASGVEPFLSMLLICYEIYKHRRELRALPPPADPDDPWRSTFDDIHDWVFLTGGGPVIIVFCSALAMAIGTSNAMGHFTRSTYICFGPIENPFTTVAAQWLGLVLDAAIVILLWRILAWARSTMLQLQFLAAIFTLSSISMAFLWTTGTLYSRGSWRFSAMSSSYAYDVSVTGMAVAVLAIAATFWVCESSPLTPVAVLTSGAGTLVASTSVFRLSDWMHLSPGGPLSALWLSSVGSICFLYIHDLRSVAFTRRVVVALLLVILLITASIFSAAKSPKVFEKRHLISDVIWRAGVEHDRWLTQARTSKSLPVAIDTYKERNGGKAPPPKFGEWYRFAQDSVSLDDYRQIHRDLEPFWSHAPWVLRQRADIMGIQPGVGTITITSGKAVGGDVDGAPAQQIQDLAEMINKFAEHLPDMVLPINLQPTPLVLLSWEEAHSQYAHDMSAMVDLISRRSLDSLNASDDSVNAREQSTAPADEPAWDLTPANSLRDRWTNACPPGSPSRVHPHWSTAEFCWSCVKKHSRGPILTRLQESLDICSQPDIKHLHGFFQTDPRIPPLRALFPLFGPSKTDGFADIMIPLPQDVPDPGDGSWKFNRKYDSLAWSGAMGKHAVNDEALGGSHKLRLLHLTDPNTDEIRDVSMVLPRAENHNKFSYEDVSLAKMNRILPMNMGITDYSDCMGDNCNLIKQAYGTPDSAPEPIEHRYALLLDEDDGPPAQFMSVLRSLTVPFVSTIFRTWYTERLTPWVHFVPIDPRYHALHSTLAYFVGTRGAPEEDINGRDVDMEPRAKDAEWIARQGRKWADKALGRYEMEVYLFRLLLEWGRLINDGRDDVGLWVVDDGQVKDTGWTHKDGEQAS